MAERVEETEAEDPKFHCSANGRLEISTNTMEKHYENASTTGKLITTPMMSVLTWKATHTSDRLIGKPKIANEMRGGGAINTV